MVDGVKPGNPVQRGGAPLGGAPLGDASLGDVPLGEFDIIDHYFAPLATTAAALGLRDDASILAVPSGQELVITCDAIVEGVVREQLRIDPLVDQHLAEGWRLNRVDSILRAILRAGAYEILLRDDVPARVVISEYIDLAHAFFEGDEPKVVNGILDKIARSARPKEFEAQGGSA